MQWAFAVLLCLLTATGLGLYSAIQLNNRHIALICFLGLLVCSFVTFVLILVAISKSIAGKRSPVRLEEKPHLLPPLIFILISACMMLWVSLFLTTPFFQIMIGLVASVLGLVGVFKALTIVRWQIENPQKSSGAK